MLTREQIVEKMKNAMEGTTSEKDVEQRVKSALARESFRGPMVMFSASGTSCLSCALIHHRTYGDIEVAHHWHRQRIAS